MTSVAPPDLTGKTNCPSCHTPASFGPRSVVGQFWITRCTKCHHYTYEPLPVITKKVLYLDQLVLSNMLFLKEPRWAELLQWLRLLSYLQVIVCPSSNVHVEESLLAESSRDVLKALYRELSGSTAFLTPHEIQQNQLLEAIGHYLRGDTSGQWQKPKPWQEFSKSDPNHWSLGLGIYADVPLDPKRVERLTKYKADLHDELKAVADYWMGDTNSFAADVKREALAYGQTLLAAYRELADRKHIEATLPPEMVAAYKMFCPNKFNPSMPPGVQPAVQLVHWLAAEVYRADPSVPDPVSVVEVFFQSKQGLEVPFQYIMSRLCATITRSGVDPQRARKAKPSDSYDVTAISHYAPYCDTMMIDNEFCAIATQKNIGVPSRFGVQLFCTKTLDKFLEYLMDLATSIPLDHRIAVKQVFPHLAGLPWLKTEESTGSIV